MESYLKCRIRAILRQIMLLSELQFFQILLRETWEASRRWKTKIQSNFWRRNHDFILKTNLFSSEQMINTVWAFPSCSHKNSVFPCRILNLFSVTASRSSRIEKETTKVACRLCFSPKCIAWLYSSQFRCWGLQNPFPASQFLLSTAKTLPHLPFFPIFFQSFFGSS